MRRLYRPLVPSGGLAFDIGSHVGDRAACFRALGARVVAVEPQIALARTLRLLSWHDEGFSVHVAAVGAFDGEVLIHLNLINPTVSTVSTAFIAAAGDTPGWTDQRWNRRRSVPQITLDTLVQRHGQPDFVKIDVEGAEAEVLAGLSKPVSALSFEFTTMQLGVAVDSVRRCVALGRYVFNAALGETQELVHRRWLESDEITAWLCGLPKSVNSGDVYARCV
jgi:FkbM family methyltransferase